MTTIDQAIQQPAAPLLKDTLAAALIAHAQIPAALEGGSVEVSASVWAQIAAALNDAKALHVLDVSTVRVNNRMSIEGEPNRDQTIEVFVPVGEGSVCGATARVEPDQKSGPDVRVSWSSIGAVRPDVARTFALGIVRAADLADEGLAKKLEQAPAANPVKTTRRGVRSA